MTKDELITKRNRLSWAFFDPGLSVAEALAIDAEVQELDDVIDGMEAAE